MPNYLPGKGRQIAITKDMVGQVVFGVPRGNLVPWECAYHGPDVPMKPIKPTLYLVRKVGKRWATLETTSGRVVTYSAVNGETNPPSNGGWDWYATEKDYEDDKHERQLLRKLEDWAKGKREKRAVLSAEDLKSIIFLLATPT